VLKVPEATVEGFRQLKARRNLPDGLFDKLEFELEVVSFGDGTGFMGGRKVPYQKTIAEGAGVPRSRPRSIK
jgi:hypothetical protein